MYSGRIGGGGTLYAFGAKYDVGNDVDQPAPVPQPCVPVTGATDVDGRTHTGADDKRICGVNEIVVAIFGGIGIAYS